MKFRFEIVGPDGLLSILSTLREIESAISYPIDGGQDAFFIDHGSDYHSFFSDMGRVLFVLAYLNDELVGSVAGVWKPTVLGGEERIGLYIADLKLHPKARGFGIAAKMIWYAFKRWPFNREYRGWDFAFFAAMQGEKGGVRRTFKDRGHLGKLTRPVAALNVYFVSPSQLASFPDGGPSAADKGGMYLSPRHLSLMVDNTGKKDFVLNSTGSPWRLSHLKPFGAGGPYLGAQLRESGRILEGRPEDVLACFAVDQRLTECISWLGDNGVSSTTVCLIHGVSFFCPSMRLYPWADMSTAEI